MNGKKAKAYRKLIQAMITRGAIQDKGVRYVTKDGNGVTLRLDPNSPRDVYRRMKKHGALTVLTGKA